MLGPNKIQRLILFLLDDTRLAAATRWGILLMLLILISLPFAYAARGGR